MLIATKVASLNPAPGKMYLIQHYVVKFVWFSPGTPVSSNKTDRHDITEILLKMKVALNTITLTQKEWPLLGVALSKGDYCTCS
jgi:hypothetical protein